MTRQSTLPSTREQVRHALLLLAVPAPARLLVDVHAALFDGDLDMPSLAGLLRAEQRGPFGADLICPALTLELTAVPGRPALSGWPVARRIVTPALARADALAMVVRVAEFVTARPRLDGATARLLRRLAETVPGGPETVDVLHPRALADAALAALAAPELAEAVAREQPARDAAAARAARLEPREQTFGLPSVPRQRGRA